MKRQDMINKMEMVYIPTIMQHEENRLGKDWTDNRRARKLLALMKSRVHLYSDMQIETGYSYFRDEYNSIQTTK